LTSIGVFGILSIKISCVGGGKQEISREGGN